MKACLNGIFFITERSLFKALVCYLRTSSNKFSLSWQKIMWLEDYFHRDSQNIIIHVIAS